MTNTGKIITGVVLGAAAIFVLVTMIDVDVSGDVEVPSVEMVGGNIELPEIETSGGELPRVDANVADVDVETEEKTITVPTGVSVDSPEEDTYAEENDLD